MKILDPDFPGADLDPAFLGFDELDELDGARDLAAREVVLGLPARPGTLR